MRLGPARQVDRGPPRALRSRQPGARPAPRRRGGRRRRPGASSACATASSTTRAPTRRTASSCPIITVHPAARALPAPPLPGRVRRRSTRTRVQVSPYRGAGRPHGGFVMERMIGRIARELGLEPDEVRRRNFIQPDEFPWDVGLTFQDGGPTRYDSGELPGGARDGARDDRRARRSGPSRPPSARAGRYLGPRRRPATWRARASGPYEGAHVRVEPSGKVFVATGLTTPGPGAPDDASRRSPPTRSAATPADVTVVTGDTSALQLGRGHVCQPRAGDERQRRGHRRRAKVRDKALRLAAELLEAAPGDLELADGAVRVGRAGPPARPSARWPPSPTRSATPTARRRPRPRSGSSSRAQGAVLARRTRSPGSRRAATTPRPRPPSPAAATPPSSRWTSRRATSDLRALRRPARLRHRGESDHRRGPDPRRRRPGHRRRALREARLRRRRAAPHRELHGLPDADRRGGPGHRDRPPRDAVARSTRSASRASARPAPSRCPRWSPRRSTTRSRRSACASGRCR